MRVLGIHDQQTGEVPYGRWFQTQSGFVTQKRYAFTTSSTVNQKINVFVLRYVSGLMRFVTFTFTSDPYRPPNK